MRQLRNGNCRCGTVCNRPSGQVGRTKSKIIFFVYTYFNPKKYICSLLHDCTVICGDFRIRKNAKFPYTKIPSFSVYGNFEIEISKFPYVRKFSRTAVQLFRFPYERKSTLEKIQNFHGLLLDTVYGKF